MLAVEQPQHNIQSLTQIRSNHHARVRPGILVDRRFVVIGIYNYKGGVGKTTTTLNLAVSACIEHGKRVLIIDADQQCNASLFFFPTDNIFNQDEPNIYSVLAPVFTGRGPVFGNGGIATIAQQCPRLLQDRVGDRLILLRGSPRIVEYQQQMSQAVNDNLPGLRNNLGVFRALVHALATELNVDLVFVDFGPSTDVLTETFVMSCDYILPPCFPDAHSNTSTQSLLTSLLPAWKDNFDRNVRRQRASNTFIEFPLHNLPPVLLPAIVTRYNNTRAHSEWISRINRTFNNGTLALETYGIQCLRLRDGENEPHGVVSLCRDLLGAYNACHSMLLPATAFRYEDVLTAVNMGENLTLGENGSWNVISDIINKFRVLSGALLTLRVPK